MHIGEKLKNARLAAGMSQRQLCGDKITRNMLSLIENGAAKPSMDTLMYLAGRLGQPVSRFLQEDFSGNRSILDTARSQESVLALETLKDYDTTDNTLDAEYFFLKALHSLRLARQMLTEGKRGYAKELLTAAQAFGAKTPYYTRELDRERICIAFLLEPDTAGVLETQLLRDETSAIRGKAALDRGDPAACLHILEGELGESADHLRAEAFFAQKDYENALKYYKRLPEEKQPFSKMEVCCRELQDYKQAYHYACLQR